MSFSEVREYTYGDDVRNIDWNVSARMHHPYIKVFEEERELTVMLLIDISRSAYYGTHQQTKNELITEISAVLSFSAINNNDKVGSSSFLTELKIHSAQERQVAYSENHQRSAGNQTGWNRNRYCPTAGIFQQRGTQTKHRFSVL